jgi:hypothetical protein
MLGINSKLIIGRLVCRYYAMMSKIKLIPATFVFM